MPLRCVLITQVRVLQFHVFFVVVFFPTNDDYIYPVTLHGEEIGFHDHITVIPPQCQNCLRCTLYWEDILTQDVIVYLARVVIPSPQPVVDYFSIQKPVSASLGHYVWGE